MKKGLVLVMVLALMVVAATANAQVFGKGKTQFQIGLTQFTAHTVDTLLIIFGTPSELAPDKHLLGFGGSIMHGLSEHWAINGGGFFGFGSDKVEYGTQGETKVSYQAFGFGVGVDYTENIGEMFGIYMGPGFEFASSKSKVKDDFFYTPAIDEDNDKVTALSLVGRIGAQAKLGRNFGLNTNLGQKWTRASSTFDFDWGGGVEETKISRWVSSMYGNAGFVIYFN